MKVWWKPLSESFLIGLPAVGVDDRVQLDIVQYANDQMLAATATGRDTPHLAAPLVQPEDGELAAGAAAGQRG